MNVYHGTSVKNAERILKEGLKPRHDQDGIVKGNWEHTVPSAGDRVYLTELYAPYFGMCASADGEPWAILEIRDDPLTLNYDKFVPDEDYLEQAMRFNGYLPSPVKDELIPQIKDLKERTEYYRDNITEFQGLWSHSLKNLGTCAYMDMIPPDNIKRAVVFDYKKNGVIAQAVMDPSIHLLNCKLMRDKYMSLTNWMMGFDITVEEYFGEVSLPAAAMMPEKQLKLVADMLKDRSALTFLKE